MIRVLVIDDDVQIRKLLRITLEQKGYRVFAAADGRDGLNQIPGNKPDLVLLDLNLPDIDGSALLKTLREWCDVPVIVLSVRDSEEDIVQVLNSGADDYMVKPFSTGELMARINVALRHSAGPNAQGGQLLCVSGISMDMHARKVMVHDKEVKLTPTEYALLKLFLTYPGRIITHSQILQAVWGPREEQESGSLRVHMNQLRKKIEDNPAMPRFLVTEPGVGYRLHE